MYKIIGADGREYGLVTAEQLRQWIREGRVNAETKVQAEGSTEWKAISAFPEFADIPAAASPVMTVPPPGSGELDIGSCISRGWKLLQNNFGRLVGTTFLVCLLLGGVGGALRFLVNTAFGVPFQVRGVHGLEIFRLQWRGMVASMLWNLIMAGPLLGGLYHYYLKLIRGQPASLADAFAGFSGAFVPLVLAHIISGVLTGLGLLLCILPGIYLGVAWKFTLPLVIDKRLGFWEAMELSRTVVSRQWWILFALFLVSGVIACLGFVACCIGIFITLPIGIAAVLYAYEDILGAQPAAPVG
ncbi:MAG TPA: GYF domain-containing protein [Verrucomicrobiae bacterium]|nr:GYF domain-containing protein [Verrucomicrobiae bacterium]